MKINESRLKSLVNRTEIITDLSDGFLSCIKFDEEDGIKSLKIKNLSFDEIQKMTDEVSISEALKNKSLEDLKSIDNKISVLNAVISIFEVLKESYSNLSAETVRRISVFKYGTLEPEINHTSAVLISKHFSLDFKKITDRILILSQMGAIPLGELEKSTKEGGEG